MKINVVSIAGGLGNQMFQYAFHLALKNKEPKIKNYFFIAKYNTHNGYELKNVFGIGNSLLLNLFSGVVKKILNIRGHKIQDTDIGTYDHAKMNQKVSTYYSGFWQSEKYFYECSTDIRKKFSFKKDKISIRNIELVNSIKMKKNTISVHIRRGDYLSEPGANKLLGGLCNLEYYENAIKYMNNKIENPLFLVFSDDITWSKKNLSFIKNVIYVDWNIKNNSWQDMYLMSMCKHNIIANSSFSWWGAWLNNNSEKIIIAPKKWFNTLDANDITPTSWIRL